MAGASVALATGMAAARYTNGLTGTAQEFDEDEVERREALKKLRRRPLHETIEQLGEGRGEFNIFPYIHTFSNRIRHICAGLRRAEASAVIGQIWHRCERGEGAFPVEER
jgi:hypothetical protein